MGRSLVLGCALAVLLGSGCAMLHLRPRHAPAAAPEVPPDGYLIKGSSVVFLFDPARYDSVTDASGRRAGLAGIEVESVNVAGEFNRWSRTAWLMSPEQRGGRARFTLAHKLAEVGPAREYGFRFLVNGEWWVEPAARTWNRRPATSTPGGYELLLKLE